MNDYELLLLKLENEKWFFYPAKRNITEEQIKKDCRIIYEFVKENPIIEIQQYISFSDTLDIDKYVKRYMKLYGIDNVRGGSYSDLTIPSFMVRTIEHEIGFSIEQIEKDLDILDSIKEEYNDIMLVQSQESKLAEQLSRISSKIQSFITNEPLKLSRKYDEYIILLTKLNKLDEMSPMIFDHLQWLSDKIKDSEFDVINDSDKTKYKDMVKVLKTVYSVFCYIRDDPNEYMLRDSKFSSVIYLKNPNIAFDCFFYHRCKNVRVDYYEGIAKEVLAEFEYMSYVIKNRKDELEYDLSCYPTDFVKRYFMTLEWVSRSPISNSYKK